MAVTFVKNNLGQFEKGITPWNKDKRGLQIAWNRGLTKETSLSLAEGGRKGGITKTGKPHGHKTNNGNLSWNHGIAWNEMRGEKHPNWKGGISKSYRKGYRDNLAYEEWRKTVFERDDYTCQGCGITGVYITAHHIKSFAKYPELRLEVSNGITLCEECHKLTDNYKGRGTKK
jgi:5-methylcytosine-specific restriction endonuclease McrA